MWLLKMPFFFAGVPFLIVVIFNISRNDLSKKMHLHLRSHKIKSSKNNAMSYYQSFIIFSAILNDPLIDGFENASGRFQ
jgi:hypothetical protein